MDNPTIEQLYHEFRIPLLRYITSKVSDPHDAQELLNDLFIKAAHSLDPLKDPTKLRSWLYRIASNLIIDHYRRQQHPPPELQDLVYGEETLEASIFQELDCCIHTFLDQLPPYYAQPLKAIYLQELTQQEYARQHALKLSTVKSHLRRGKAAMKQFFEHCCAFEKDRFNHTIDCIPKRHCSVSTSPSDGPLLKDEMP